MFRLVTVQSSMPLAHTKDLLGDEAALRWLEIAEEVSEKDLGINLEYALTLGNTLYLLVDGPGDVNPLRFALRGSVSRRYDVTPTIKVQAFDTPDKVVFKLLSQGKLMLQLLEQLSQQYPELVDMRSPSMTGASIDFLEDPRRYRWNGFSHTPALSPLAKYLVGKDLDIMEDLCVY